MRIIRPDERECNRKIARDRGSGRSRSRRAGAGEAPGGAAGEAARRTGGTSRSAGTLYIDAMLSDVRVGHGYDLHRLEPHPPRGRGRPFILAGVPIDHPLGPVAHSDGDAVLHAVTDAVLGALGLPDIGALFPDSDAANEGADSSRFLTRALELMRDAGYSIGNVDVTVICEQPKIGPHKARLRRALAAILACDESRVNIKGKTHEGLDAVGEGRGIEVHCVALLGRLDGP
jgi:2-C-methyl-D-erythritol 2,4-cyclodiphosphate synthase